MILTDKNKVKEILHFNDACTYTLLAIARKKDNEGITNSQEIVFREVVNSEEQFDRKYDRLVKVIESDSHNFKLYITFNPRSILKAYSLLKQKFVHWDYNLTTLFEETLNRIGRIHNEWMSCLQSPKAVYKKNYFMLDIDNTLSSIDILDIQQIIIRLSNIKVNQIENFITQNGQHILFPPCDTRKIMENLKPWLDVELKRDALVCIGYYEKEEKE